MGSLIHLAINNNRVVLFSLLFIFIVGTVTYLSMPRESEPDVAIPMIYVSISHDGISPEDAERLLIRPMEKELRTIEGIKELRGTASEGHAAIILEFDAGLKATMPCVMWCKRSTWRNPNCLPIPMNRWSMKSTSRFFRF